jgi:hypothetical protein
MLFHWPVGIDDDHQTVRLHPFAQVPEESIGCLHLMIHVDQENAVE